MSAIRSLIPAKLRDIGFPVRRAIPALECRSLGPFVFLDHMGPVRFSTGSSDGDVRPHPHIGLATVTYLFAGAILHRDSLGSVQRIEPGAVNWMTAGDGIVHSERIPDDIRAHGQALEGVQMWVALPAAMEDCAPVFRHYGAEMLPLVSRPGARVRVLCGRFAEAQSPVDTPSPTLFLGVELDSGGSITVAPDHAERGIYLLCGRVLADGEAVAEGELAVLEPGATVTLSATEETRLMVLGGAPLDGSRHLWWNFVSSSEGKIEAARQRWLRQEFPRVPGETEFIPLPEHR